MNHRRINLFGLVVFWWVLGHAPPATALPPEIQAEVSWISEQELTQRGIAAIRELPQGDRLAAEGMLRGAAGSTAQDPETCDVVGKSGAADLPADPASKLRKDKYAFLGRVLEREEGLSHGIPVAFYTVEVDRLLRWPASESKPDTVYILHNTAAVKVEGVVLCSEAARGPVTPQIGKEIIVITDSVVRLNPTFIHPLNEDLFFETSDGNASVPGSGGMLDLKPWELLRDELLAEVP